MTISNPTRIVVLKLNDLIRQELGQPQHSWVWSEDLTVSMRVPDKYEHKADPDSGLLILMPIFAVRRQLPFHAMRWVFCVKGYVPEAEWLNSIGTRMEYPANGMWQVIGTPTGPMCLNQGETPNEDLTWGAIRAIRQERLVTAATFKNVLDDRIEKREQTERGTMFDRCRDAMTPSIPGKKANISYPSPSRKLILHP